uniref:Mesoderm posterior aa n=1 Tax=Scleropages formosus TaxID=113540 RepID=A0A8C9SLU3_SCLFO
MSTGIMDLSLSNCSLPFYPCHTLLELGCADTGYYSGSDSLSPASSVESCSPFQWGMEQGATARLTVRGRQAAVQDKKKSRSKHPGKKRQSASEREKLRMRGLTKALHNLRTYLPPSVAPPGQTLTKIETLRLTIRYIAHLSAQLGLDEEVQHEGTKVDTSVCLSSPETQECCQYSFMPAQEKKMKNEKQFNYSHFAFFLADFYSYTSRKLQDTMAMSQCIWTLLTNK